MAIPEIAYVFERFPSFGQTFCYREVAELFRQGINVRIFSLRHPNDEPNEAWDEKIGRKVEYLPAEAELVPKIDRALRKGEVSAEVRGAVGEWGRQSDFLRLYQAIYIGLRLQSSGPWHVHAHFAGMAARTAWWLEKFFAIPFSFTAHANDIFAPRDFKTGLDQLVATARTVVTVSDFSKKYLRTRFPYHAAKILRVYNGIELDRFLPANFSSEIPTIVSVGRLIEKKGFADLIAACAILKDRGCKFRCEIIGEGPLESELRSQIKNLAVDDLVKLLGARTQEEIARHLADATVFVLPCTVERDGGMDNLPTVIMEAMAAGLPVISTPIAGVPEMVDDNETGWLVPDRDPAALADAIAKIISDPSLARLFGERGLTTAREKFSIETSVRKLREIFAA